MALPDLSSGEFRREKVNLAEDVNLREDGAATNETSDQVLRDHHTSFHRLDTATATAAEHEQALQSSNTRRDQLSRSRTHLEIHIHTLPSGREGDPT